MTKPSEDKKQAAIAEAKKRRPENIDRTRGVLTTKWREYYLGNDTDHESENSLRYDIRRATQNAILDFPILAQNMEDRDINQVYYPDMTPQLPAKTTSNNIQAASPSLIAFLFRAEVLTPAELPTDNTGETPQFTRHIQNQFGRIIESGLRQAIQYYGYTANIDVQIDVELEAPVSEITDRLEGQGVGAVSEEELHLLKDQGKITPTRFHELMLKKHQRREEQFSGEMRPIEDSDEP